MEKNTRAERNYGIDLFRVLCMFLITFDHLEYTSIASVVENNTFAYYSLLVLRILTLVMINGFVLISGYHMCQSAPTARKIVDFWLQLIFYCVVVFVAMLLITGDFSFNSAVRSLFPVLSQHYWYPVSYLALMFLSPFINKWICALTRREYILILVFLFILIELWLSANPFFDSSVYMGHQTHGIFWFVFLYLLAGYMRIYGVCRKRGWELVLFLITFALAVGLNMASNNKNSDWLARIQVLDFNGIFALLMSVSLFIVFLNIKIKQSLPQRIIRFITPALWGTYLVQEHNSVRYVFWGYVDSILPCFHNPVIIVLIAFLLFLFVSIGICHLYNLCQRLFLYRLTEKILGIIYKISKRIEQKLELDNNVSSR